MLVMVILLTALQVNAGSGFKDKDGILSQNLQEVFEDVSKGSLGHKNKYPFSSEKATIQQVGFDILYGTSKPLLRYIGEVPYSNTHENGSAGAGMWKLPYIKENPTIDNEDYWGKTGLSNEQVTRTQLEGVNDKEIVSLRLFALASTSKIPVIGIIYNLISFVAYLFGLFIWLIISIKNINITVFMEALKLDKINDLLVKLFIMSDGADGTRRLAPAMIFALVALVITIVGYFINFLTGGKKAKDLFGDIIVVVIFGSVIIGTALTGRTVEVGSYLSDITNQFLVSVNPTMQDNNIFDTRVVGGNSTQTITTVESSTINKAYIDAQICTQFGVDSIEELSFKSLGDTTGEVAKQYLLGYNKNTNIDNNLGYYFWFANSSAKNLTNSEIPNISETQTDKLSSMVTYLQVLYNHGTDEVKANIRNIMLNLSSPSIGFSILKMIVLACVLLGTGLCLGKYAFKVAFSKLGVLLGVIAMPIAGILIITTNKKSVKMGKGMLGIFAVSILKVTIFSMFFDLVIFVISSMLNTNIVVMVIALVALIAMYKFNPVIEKALDGIIRDFERTLSPESARLKNDMKIWARQKLRSAKDKTMEARQKIVGYDDNGMPIYAKQKGMGALTTALEIAENALQENPINTRSTISIVQKGIDLAKKNAESVKKTVTSVDNANALDKAEKAEQGITKAGKDEFNKTYDSEEGTYNTERLTDEENIKYNKIKETQDNIDKMTTKYAYYNDRLSNLTPEEEKDRQTLGNIISDQSKRLKEEEKRFKDSIVKSRTLKEQMANKQDLLKTYDEQLKTLEKDNPDVMSQRLLLEKKMWAVKNDKLIQDQKLTDKDMEYITRQIKSINYNKSRSMTGKLIDRTRTKGEIPRKDSEQLYSDMLQELSKQWSETSVTPVETGIDKLATETSEQVKEYASEPEKVNFVFKTDSLQKTRELFNEDVNIDDGDSN